MKQPVLVPSLTVFDKDRKPIDKMQESQFVTRMGCRKQDISADRNDVPNQWKVGDVVWNLHARHANAYFNSRVLIFDDLSFPDIFSSWGSQKGLIEAEKKVISSITEIFYAILCGPYVSGGRASPWTKIEGGGLISLAGDALRRAFVK